MALALLLAGITSSSTAFQMPARADQNDLLFRAVVIPVDTDALFYTALLHNALATLQHYQHTIEQCILATHTVQDCDNAAPPYTPQNALDSLRLNVHDGIIVLYPRYNPDIPASANPTLIATPRYLQGSVHWDYSGNVFDPKKLLASLQPQRPATPFHCPDPTTFPATFSLYSYFTDAQGQKYQISGYKDHITEVKQLTFLWAAFPAAQQKHNIACVYKIGDDAVLTDNWVALTTVMEVAEPPKNGLWGSTQRGICPKITLDGADPADCPFKLEQQG